MKKGTFILLLSLLLTACGGGSGSSTSTRSFYMGFTQFPYDLTQAAVDDVYNKISMDADMITHHLDNGIPWNDALSDTYPYNSHIMDDWNQRRSKTPAGHKVYLAITPIGITRDTLAPLRDTADDMALLPPFDTYAAAGDFNHLDVKTAYLNYCRRIIAYFNPDYLAIGIEVNLLRKETDAATWAKYKELNDFIYANLKIQYPNLPIFASISAVELVQGYGLGLPTEFTGDPAGYEASQRTALQDVLASSDFYAISLYPFLSAFYDTAYPSDFLSTLFSLSSKPLAIAETGMLAESINAFSIDFIGSQTLQNNYLTDLLDELEQHSARFVSWFVLQDYDALCVAIGPCVDTNLLWRDTGLYDGFGNPRPAHASWKERQAYVKN